MPSSSVWCYARCTSPICGSAWLSQTSHSWTELGSLCLWIPGLDFTFSACFLLALWVFRLLWQSSDWKLLLPKTAWLPTRLQTQIFFSNSLGHERLVIFKLFIKCTFLKAETLISIHSSLSFSLSLSLTLLFKLTSSIQAQRERGKECKYIFHVILLKSGNLH